MDARAALERLGGVGTAAQVIALSSRRDLRAAVTTGEIVRLSRGRYASAQTSRDRRVASEMSGICSHLSAALHWDWAVKWPPDRPWVTVRRKRNLDDERRILVNLAYADLDDDEVRDGVTSPARTVLDCARRLAFDEALAVADSALRSGLVSAEELRTAAAGARGRGARACRRVAAEADAKAANPFESVLRALVLEFPELHVVPQVGVAARGRTWHPDLVDVGRRLVIEADSWEFHTGRDAHDRDCVRYTALSLAGWTILRFTWEQVMRSPAYVRDVLADLLREKEAVA